jgi:hypothetical protein
MADNDLPTKMDNLAKSHPRSVELAHGSPSMDIGANRKQLMCVNLLAHGHGLAGYTANALVSR